MKKIWTYLSAFLGGALLMALAALKWFAGDSYKIAIRKIKQRGEGNILESDLDVNLIPRDDRRQRNKEKREAERNTKTKIR